MPGTRPLLVLLALVVALAAPATAPAATDVWRSSAGVLYVDSGLLETNDVSVEVEAGTVVVEEHAAAIGVGAGCVAGPREGTAACGAPDGLTRVELTLGPGGDVARGSSSDVLVTRWISGEDGDDTLIGGRGADRLWGGSGRDTLDGGRGDDDVDGQFDGGARDVVAYGFDRSAGISAHLPPTGSLSGGNGDRDLGESDVLRGVEEIHGSPYGDILYGTAAAEGFDGKAGNDAIRPYGGDDIVEGGDGDDGFYEEPVDGDDIYRGGGHSADGDRRDIVYYYGEGPVNARLPDLAGDWAETHGNGEAGESDTFAGIESVHGSSGDDILQGGDGPNFIAGNGGGDLVLGNGGDDRLDGGGGADDILGGEGDDVLLARDREADSGIDCGPGDDGLRADNALEISPRPEGCETLAPQFTGTAVLTGGTPRVGSVLGVAGVETSGDAPSGTWVTWYLCQTVVEGEDSWAECDPTATGPAFTVPDSALGKTLYADVEVRNAGGWDYAETAYTDAVLPALPPVVVAEQPATIELPRTETPVVALPPKDVAVTPVVTGDPFLAIAKRLIGAKAKRLGRAGPVQAFSAGRSLALVCQKPTCRAAVRITSGRRVVRRRTLKLAAGTGAKLALPRGAKVGVRLTAGGKRLRKTLRVR
jgi:hypothetical protein